MHASAVLSADVDSRVARLRADRASQDFVAAYGVMGKCGGAVTHGTGADANCDTALFAADRAKNPVNLEIAKLADVVSKRSRALQALGGAYAALGDEAAFDEPGQIDEAVSAAVSAVSTFSAAVGLGPVGAVAGQGIQGVAHILAANSQKRRLVKDSRRIAAVTQAMRLAMVKERDLFGELDALLSTLDQETRTTFLKANLLDPTATVKSIGTSVGLTVPDAKLSAGLASDPALRAAGEVAYLDTMAPVSSGDLDAGIALLSDLEAQHLAFEKGEPLDLRRIAQDVEKLDAILATSKG